MAKAKFIFFDLANTLVHLPDFYQSIHLLFSENNIKMDAVELKRTHRILSEEIQFPDKTDKNFYLEFNSVWLNRMGINSNKNLVESIYEKGKGHHWKVFEDTVHLRDLKIPMGIISNWDTTLNERLKGFFDFDFDIVIGSALVGYQKPDPKIFELAIQQTGLQPEEIIMVGDSIRLDVNSALNLGIRGVLIDRDQIFTNFNGDKISGLHELNNLL